MMNLDVFSNPDSNKYIPLNLASPKLGFFKTTPT